MTFDDILEQAIEMLRRRGRLTYRALRRQFDLDDEYLDDLKEELIKGQQLAVDEDGEVLVWIGDTESASSPPTSGPASAQSTSTSPPIQDQKPPPISYTPTYLTEKILTSRRALEDERKLVEQHSFTPLGKMHAVLSCDEVLRCREAVARIPAAPNVMDYAVRLVRATRPDDPRTPEYIKRWVRWGASPRASQNLILAGRARAACEGRFNVACDDVAALAKLVLRHRLIRSFQADAEGVSTDDMIDRLLEEVPPTR